MLKCGRHRSAPRWIRHKRIGWSPRRPWGVDGCHRTCVVVGNQRRNASQQAAADANLDASASVTATVTGSLRLSGITRWVRLARRPLHLHKSHWRAGEPGL